MMKLTFAAATAMAALFTASAASAQELDVSANVGVVSDYVFRGFSQTDSNPALQGGVDATYGGFYAGVWASNVDFGDDTDAEVDIYGGYRTEAGGFALDFGVVNYFYVNAPDATDYDYLEVKAAASRAIGPATVGVAAYFSPDFFGLDEEATYLEANAAFTPVDSLTVSGAVGKQWLDVNDDYTTWNIGAAYAFGESVALDVRYHDTDVDGTLSEDRYVVGLKFLF